MHREYKRGLQDAAELCNRISVSLRKQQETLTVGSFGYQANVEQVHAYACAYQAIMQLIKNGAEG